jgi:hypothetical protein
MSCCLNSIYFLLLSYISLEMISFRDGLLLENIYFVQFEVFTAGVMKSIILWDMTPCSPLSLNRRFCKTCRLHLGGRRSKFSKNQQTIAEIISSTLKMEEICSSEMSVETQRTTRPNIPENNSLQNLFFLPPVSAAIRIWT